MPLNQTTTFIKIDWKKQGFESKNSKKVMCATISEEETRAGQILQPLSENPTTRNTKRNPTLGQWKQNTLANNKEDRAMGRPEVLLTHSLAKNHNTTQSRDKGLEEGADGCSTPKIKLTFDPSGGCDGLAQRKWANANPFEALNKEDEAFDFFRKAPEALEGGYTFQRFPKKEEA